MLDRIHLGAALLLLLLLVLLVLRRWRREADRKEKVRRLMLLAAAEEDRVEKEAAVAFSVTASLNDAAAAPRAAAVDVVAKVLPPPHPSPPPLLECVLCSSPATGRCARCKAVRYCSGKCQIIHWRQGHKDECHPPSANVENAVEFADAGLNNEESKQPSLNDENAAPENLLNVKVAENQLKGSTVSASPDVLVEENEPNDKNPRDASLKEKDFGNGIDASVDEGSLSSLFATASDASSSVGPLVSEDAGRGESTVGISSNNGGITVDTSGDKSIKDPIPAVDTRVSEENELPPSHLKHETSLSRTEAVEWLTGPTKVASSMPIEHKNQQCDAGRGESTVGISSNNGGITVDTSGDKSIKDPIPAVDTGVSEENELPPSHLKHETSLFRTEAVEWLTGPTKVASSMPIEHKNQQCDAGAESMVLDHVTTKSQDRIGAISSDFESKMSSMPTIPESTLKMKPTKKLSFYTTSSDPVATISVNDTLLQNKKISRSSSASGSNQLSSNDGCPAFHKVSQIDVSISSATSVNSSNLIGLPTSVNGIVTQLPASKISRNYPSESTLFPYDLFIKLYNDKVEFRPCGLINIGNSCYANVVLQCLKFTRPLMTYFFEGLHSKTCSKKDWCFTCELERLFMNSKQTKSPLSTMGILSHLEDIGTNFGRGKQEDAHEFLRYAIDAMQSVCLKETGAKPGEPLAEETTLIQQTYGGYLRSTIICCKCKGKSERCERMMDLAVEIDGDIDKIEEALRLFASPETLDGENKYKCDRCKSYERAEKQLRILEAPNVLTIALKRFQSGQFGKLNKVVRFHEYLDLAPYMCKTDDKTPIYRLYAIIVHIDIMNASSSGHYICYVKDTQEKWYEIDDSKVRPVEFSKVLARNAYILFYARCLPRAPSLVRNAMAYELMKINRKWKSKSQHCPSVAFRPGQLHERNVDDLANSRSSLSYDGDSDNSSLFSCSDECSCSTDSTKESTTSDESLDASNSPLRFSPESNSMTGSSLNHRHSSSGTLVSDSSRSSDSSCTSSSGPQNDKAESGKKRCIKSTDALEADVEGKASRPDLYPDKSKGFRHLTENYRSTETDRVNTSEAESGVMLRRRSSREQTAQTFY